MGKLLDFASMARQVERIKELRDKYGDEKILVVRTKLLPPELIKEGFIYSTEISLDFLLNEASFIPRYDAEYNSNYKQPIPYVLVKNKGRYFSTKRLSASGEQRLINKIALGMGGHINPVDMSAEHGRNIFENAVYRELVEELDIPNASLKLNFVGYINDFSNSVGKDHLGLLYIANIELDNPNDEISVKEIDKLDGGLINLTEIKSTYSKLEKWSQIVFDEVLSCWGISA